MIDLTVTNPKTGRKTTWRCDTEEQANSLAANPLRMKLEAQCPHCKAWIVPLWFDARDYHQHVGECGKAHG